MSNESKKTKNTTKRLKNRPQKDKYLIKSRTTRYWMLVRKTLLGKVKVPMFPLKDLNAKIPFLLSFELCVCWDTRMRF